MIHATVVAAHVAGSWRGVLLRGPSGSGKSDLALRLIGAGWRLVSDDYATVWASSGRLFAAPPATIAGRLEARGVGLVPQAFLPFSEGVLVVDLGGETPERLPGRETEILEGVALPRLRLDAFEASAPAKVRLALHATVTGSALGA